MPRQVPWFCHWLCLWLCLRLCGWLIRSCLCSLICPLCSPLQICAKTFIPTFVELAHFALILPKSPLPERLLARHALMLAMHLIFPRLLSLCLAMVSWMLIQCLACFSLKHPGCGNGIYSGSGGGLSKPSGRIITCKNELKCTREQVARQVG